MKDEKYVSIEFDTWENTYKPMEEENIRLREQLKEHKIKVHIYLSGMPGGGDKSIGYLDFVTSNNENRVEWNQRDGMDRVIKEGVYEAMTRCGSERWYIGRNEVDKKADDIKTLIKEFQSISELNARRIAGIPPIIKWIFRIK